jgi:hypothetical protein
MSKLHFYCCRTFLSADFDMALVGGEGNPGRFMSCAICRDRGMMSPINSVILVPLPDRTKHLLYIMRLALSSRAVCFFLGHAGASQLVRSSDVVEQ